MAEVPEINLDIQNNAEEIPDNTVDKVEIPDLPDIEEVPKPKAKARGRPKGAANKGPSKPRAKKAPAAPPPQAEVPVYEPSSPKRNLSIPSYDRTDELASQMLRLLAGQAQDRQQKKRDLYASWMR
jgi:hypothetical protein